MSGRGPADRAWRDLAPALLACVLCTLVAPSAAVAAHSLGISLEEPSPGLGKVIFYSTNPGETNNVTVAFDGTTSSYIVTDSGATSISDADGAGAGCEPVTGATNTYSCPDPTAKATCFDPFVGDTAPARTIRRFTVRTHDQNDVVTVNPDVTLDGAMFGGRGNDTLNGTACTDFLSGGPQSGDAFDQNNKPLDNDILFGNAGNDHLEGAIGDDVLHPGLGDDYDVNGIGFGIVGGTGTDTISYSERTDRIKVDMSDTFGIGGTTNNPCSLSTAYDWAEVDTIDRNLGTGVENVEGSQANDCIVGSRFSNTIRGGPGADLLSGEQGNDTVDYSERTQAHPVTVSLGPTLPQGAPLPTGNDGEAGEGDYVLDDVENITGGAGNDTLTGQDRVAATSGNNPRLGQEGANRLDGGPGNDTLEGKGDSDSFDGGTGIDTVTYAGRTAGVVGSIGDGNDDGSAEDLNDLTRRRDTILDTIENVIGGESDDILRGDAKANELRGEGGNDSINGGAGNDALLGGGGDDFIEGAGDDDSLAGEAGNDDLDGGEQNDQLDGGEGDDLLDGGTGSDSMAGSLGIDAANYSSRLAPVAASADGVGGDGEAGEGDNIATDVEDLLGGIDDDVLVGNGSDGVLEGGGGDDLLDGGGGADDLVGGPGADHATYAGRTGVVTVDLTTFGGDGEAGEDDEIFDDVEKVSGGVANDTILGDGAGNILHGGDGIDTINGGDGFDLLHGDGGNDNLNGAGGTDLLFGDAGNDALLGGADNDILSGGADDDSLDGSAGEDVLNGNAGSDTATYASRTAAVTATLDGAPDDGQSGESDLIKKDVENLTTGSGNDTLNSADGQISKVSCGRGTDTVTADTNDDVESDCEIRNVGQLARCAITSGSVSLGGSGVVRIRVNCPAAGRGTLRVRSGRGKFGSKRFRARAGRVITVKVKLSKKGRRAVKRAKRNRLRVSATVSSIRSGKATTARGTTRRITIRARGG